MNNKLILFGIVLILLSSFVSASTLFSDDFDRAIIGSNWNSSTNAVIESNIIKLPDTSTSAGEGITRYDKRFGDDYSVSIDFKSTDTTQPNIYVRLERAGGGQIVYIIGDGSGNIQNYDGGSNPIIQAISNNVWYNIKVYDFDISAGTYKINISGTYKGTYNMRNKGDTVLYQYYGTNIAGVNTLYLDNYEFCDENGCDIPPVDNTEEQTEQTTQLYPINQYLSSTTFTNVLKGYFNTTNTTNNYVSFVINAIAPFSDETLKCKVKIDGTTYAQTTDRTMETGQAGIMYIASSNFTLAEGEHRINLKCKTINGNYVYLGNMLGILHTLKNQETNKSLNMKSVSLSKSITSTTYQNLGNITFEVSNNSVNSDYDKFILIDGAVQYNYDSDSTITLQVRINGTNLSEYPRYGNAGNTGNVGSLRYYQPLQINDSNNITIELWGKSSTGDGDISGDMIIKEMTLHTTEVNSTQLAGTTIPANTEYQNIKSLNLTSTHQANLVVKAGLPLMTTTTDARVYARLKIQSENGSVEVRDLGNPNQAGVLIIQDVFENIYAGDYIVTLQIKNDDPVTIEGGDLTAYFSDYKPFIPEFFNVTAIDRTTHSTINDFNVTNVNGTLFLAVNGIAEVISENATDNLTITAPEYVTRHIYNHNTSKDLEVQMCSIYNYVSFNSSIDNTPIENADVIIKYPDNTEITKTTDSNGRINWTTTDLGMYEVTLNTIHGFITPFNVSLLINETTCALNMNYSIAQANLIFNIYDRTTGLLLNKNVTIDVLGYVTGSTDNGTLILRNKTMASGEYTVQATSDGYSTEQATFAYTNEENLTINFYLLNLTESTAGTLFISTMDEIFRILQGVKVSLYEYQPATLSYVKISECLTNTNGECAFAIELGTKRYISHAEKEINGVLLSDHTNLEGTLYLVDNQLEQLTLRASDVFQSTILDNLVYTITESFNETTNVSDIDVEFKTINGAVTDVCVGYYLDEGTSITLIKEFCENSSSAYLLLNTELTLTDRTKNYVAKVYNVDNGQTNILQSFYYPAVSELPELLKENNISAIVILFVWVLIFGFAIMTKQISLALVLGLVWTWVQKTITSDLFAPPIAVAITIILFMLFAITRKQEEQQ